MRPFRTSRCPCVGTQDRAGHGHGAAPGGSLPALPDSLRSQLVVLLLLQQPQLLPRGGLRGKAGQEMKGPPAAKPEGPHRSPAARSGGMALTWARSRCCRCPDLAAFLKEADMAERGRGRYREPGGGGGRVRSRSRSGRGRA